MSTLNESSRDAQPPMKDSGWWSSRVWIAVAAALFPFAAYAQQEGQDREEFDRAARRAVFSTVPIAETKLFKLKSTRSDTSNMSARSPRPVRVILASPYGR